MSRSHLPLTQFYEPGNDDLPVFVRAEHHIESSPRRGLILGPQRATSGLLLLEMHGNSGVKTLLQPALKSGFRTHHRRHVFDIAAIADEEALRRFLEQAAIQNISLKRQGMPRDIADTFELPADETELGRLELKITPENKAADLVTRILARVHGDDGASDADFCRSMASTSRNSASP